jgi:hypothetical protein
MLPLLPTTLVGSYAQPDWLIDREKLGKRFPPRVRARELWRVAPEWLEQAQDDATIIAIRDQERAGLDIITDGEMRRESYSNRFATALDGVDIDNPGTALDRSGHPNPVPRVVGPIKRRHPVQVRDVKFLRAQPGASRGGGWPMLNGGDPPPSLHEHYTRFIATTERSAPVRRIATFGLTVGAACAFSLAIARQVLKFRTKARMRVTPPLHRTPHGQ